MPEPGITIDAAGDEKIIFRNAAENQAEMARQKAAAAKSRPFRDDDVANRRRLAFEPKP